MWDLVLRYGAAYSCTLIAVAAAQLVIRTDVALMLGMLTLLGLPVSLWLRSTGLRFGERKIPRPLINSLMMGITCLVTALVLGSDPRFSIDRLFQLAYATQTIQILMQVFLVLSVCRCLAIINDKDAVLCTVPSFSVLLLLIVVHKEVEVVLYFLMWAVTAALLLALDQRAEARRGIAAHVPPVVPDQEIKLSSRSLAGVMAFSLTCAVMFSYGVTSDEDKRNDNWLMRLFTRVSSMGGELQDSSVNNGPERQIDFNSGPALPTRTPLWRVFAKSYNDNIPIRPSYWRMFTYTKYDGKSWSQLPGQGVGIPIQLLSPEQSTLDANNRFSQIRQRFPGYDVSRRLQPLARARAFGRPRAKVSYSIQALVPNTGFVPTLPGVQTLIPRMAKPPEILRAREDAALDIGILNQTDVVYMVSDVVAVAEYGTEELMRRTLGYEQTAEMAKIASELGPPLKRLPASKPNASGLELSASERAAYLQLPSTLPTRIKDWSSNVIAGAPADASEYVRARLLVTAIQRGANYTLRPPIVPENRDATDFFLFGSKRGYCTYFAGALAVTCRAVGIPARVVTGFTNPEWSADGSEAILREAGSHAWTEIWVPHWGWTMLDATPPASRGENSPTLFQNWQDFAQNGLEAVVLSLQKSRVPYSVTFALLSLLMIGLWWSGRRQAWKYANAMHLEVDDRTDFLARREIHQMYRSAARQIARRYRPVADWETPLEWFSAAEKTLQLRDSEPLRRLIDLYVQARYNPHPLTQHEIEAARQAQKALNWERERAENK